MMMPCQGMRLRNNFCIDQLMIDVVSDLNPTTKWHQCSVNLFSDVQEYPRMPFQYVLEFDNCKNHELHNDSSFFFFKKNFPLKRGNTVHSTQ